MTFSSTSIENKNTFTIKQLEIKLAHYPLFTLFPVIDISPISNGLSNEVYSVSCALNPHEIASTINAIKAQFPEEQAQHIAVYLDEHTSYAKNEPINFIVKQLIKPISPLSFHLQRLAASNHIAPPILYANKEDSIQVMTQIKGEHLTQNLSDEHLAALREAVVTLHKLGQGTFKKPANKQTSTSLLQPEKFDVCSSIINDLNKINELDETLIFGISKQDLCEINAIVNQVHGRLNIIKEDNTFIHCDLNPYNILFSQNNTDPHKKINVTFLDWDYACFTDVCWDLACIMYEFKITGAKREQFISHYCQQAKLNQKDIKEKVELYEVLYIVACILWVVLSEVNAHNPNKQSDIHARYNLDVIMKELRKIKL
ncbi:phosphotransferase [Flocculibacter collagenilyticus]|uniref:phosphotransferase n=1 Tax=Flocculibacter collagenilyticus TaxID=2744479 RepID=UPI0018F7C75E|nr:phosphotransferase [Flocculibacter collagenilyticus]